MTQRCKKWYSGGIEAATGRNDSSDEQINRGDGIGRGPLERRYLFVSLNEYVWRGMINFLLRPANCRHGDDIAQGCDINKRRFLHIRRNIIYKLNWINEKEKRCGASWRKKLIRDFFIHLWSIFIICSKLDIILLIASTVMHEIYNTIRKQRLRSYCGHFAPQRTTKSSARNWMLFHDVSARALAETATGNKTIVRARWGTQFIAT